MKVKPLHDRILVQRVAPVDVTPGGIIIPDVAKDKPLEGVVVAVGNGKVLDSGVMIKPDLKVGDRIFFGKYSGYEMEIDDEEYTMMREDDVLCKIK